MLKELILKNRSYRRFDENARLSVEELAGFVEMARLSPSSRNMQPLKYILSWEKEKNDKIFPALAWAGYLKEWPGPEKGERPSAYIIMLGDSAIMPAYSIDPGIAAQSILLGAVEKGFGGCIIGTVRKEDLRLALGIPEKMDVLYVIAIGKPVEEVVIEPINPDGDVRYWRDEKKVHHVPKRNLEDLILKL